MEKIYLSQKGYDDLKKELKYLQQEKRLEVSKKIQVARAHGDLKENGEYHAAREEQGLLEARISEMSDKLARATVLDNSDISSDAIYIGATVTLKDKDLDKVFVYSIVTEDESNFSQKKISIHSPIGKALLGHKVGDSVDIVVPARTIHYEVIKIERL